MVAPLGQDSNNAKPHFQGLIPLANGSNGLSSLQDWPQNEIY